MSYKAIQYVEDYLGITTTWIYNQIAFNKDFEHHVFAQNLENLEQFPVDYLHSYQYLSPLKKWYNQIWYKIFKFYPYYLSLGKEIDANIIHAHFGNIGYKTLALKKALHIPLVVTFYGHDISKLPKKSKYRKRYKRLFKEADLFLLEGSHMANELVKLGCPPEKTRVFHLGTDVEKIQYHDRMVQKKEPVKLLFVGRLTEKKGCEFLIRAYAKVLIDNPNANISLKLIGQGDLQERIISLAKQLNVFDKITFENYIPFSLFVEELSKADIFISPSVTAKNGDTEGGAPVSLIDAQASGLAIISSFHADIPEVVQHDKTGLLSKEKDVNAIAKHIQYFLDNPEKIAEFGKRGRQHIEQNYNIKIQGERLAEIYREMIEKK